MPLNPDLAARNNEVNGFDSPYPGLRPFQEKDAEYFFGRDDQIKEISNRLVKNRFVAVIGGSGSGKSSLVLAGVIPWLRTSSLRSNLEFRSGGDFWVPVITTPGTDHKAGNPLRRIAIKFCEVLKEVPMAERKARIKDCETLLRERNGLGELVNKYGRDLKDSDGVDLSLRLPSNDADAASYAVPVNFLFLVDQFEELFHPSNDAVKDDCEQFVCRIVEQFKSRHPQVCIALTMRSEHLNDCPRYMDLPDAINATAYLVKRLTDQEIREAIEEPAQQFLQRQFVATRPHTPDSQVGLLDVSEWPEEIGFDPDVVKRLLCDADQMVSKLEFSDHLPLLQHALYWIWRSAMDRRMPNKPFPDAIIRDDLYTAVYPTAAMLGELDETVNTLELCLQNHCEELYLQDPDRQAGFKTVFRSLAFKEPNIGAYTQKRALIDALAFRLELSGPDALKEYLLPWLEPHPYIFWDELSHSIKVAHESLIRRWGTFRKWIDEDDRQFQVYQKLLDECVQWIDNGKSDTDLSPERSLRLFETQGLTAALKDEDTLRRLDQLIGLDRDRERLTKGRQEVKEFLKRSLDKEAAVRAKAELEAVQIQLNKRLRKRRRLVISSLLTFTLLAFGLVFVAWQIANSVGNALSYSSVIQETDRIQRLHNYSFKSPDGPQLPLRHVILAAEFMAKELRKAGRTGNKPLIKRLFSREISILENTRAFQGRRATDALKDVLVKYVWIIDPDSAASTSKATEVIREPEKCRVVTKDGIVLGEGRFYLYLEGGWSSYGLIALKEPVVNDTQGGTQLLWGRHTGSDCTTDIQQQRITRADPGDEIGLDANLTNIIVRKPHSNDAWFTALSWPLQIPPEDGTNVPYFSRAPVKLEKSLFSAATDGRWPVFLKTAYSRCANDINVGGIQTRLFRQDPRRVDRPVPSTGVSPARPGQNQICGAIITRLSGRGRTDLVFGLEAESQKFCLAVSLRNGNGYFADLYSAGGVDAGRESDVVPVPLATGLRLGEKPPTQVIIDKDYIRFTADDPNVQGADSDGKKWFEVAWSWDAWSKMAQDGIQKPYRKLTNVSDDERAAYNEVWYAIGKEKTINP